MTRRRFLTYLGTGSAALAAGSSGVLAGCSEGEEQEAAQSGSSNGQAAPAQGGEPTFFSPIEPSDADEVVLQAEVKPLREIANSLDVGST